MSVGRSYVFSMTLARSAAGWSFGTYVLFLVSQGLSLFEANLVNTVFMLANVLFESPTGYLADRYGQKKSHLAGVVCWGAAFGIYGASYNFVGFALAEIMAALGHSFMSGALDSWLRNLTNKEEAHRAKAISGTMGPIISIPSAVLGSFIGATFGFRWVWAIAAANCLVAAILTWIALSKHPESKTFHEGEAIGFRQAYEIVLGHKELRFLCAASLLLFVALQPFNMFWSVIFAQKSGGAWWLGTLWIGVALATAFGSRVAYLRGFPVNGAGVAFVIASIGLPMFVAPFVPGVFLLVSVFLVHEIGRGAYEPVVFTYSNDHIQPSIRATSNSIRAQAQAAGAVIGLLLSGFLTLWFAPVVVWGMAGALILALAFCAFLRKE